MPAPNVPTGLPWRRSATCTIGGSPRDRDSRAALVAGHAYHAGTAVCRDRMRSVSPPHGRAAISQNRVSGARSSAWRKGRVRSGATRDVAVGLGRRPPLVVRSAALVRHLVQDGRDRQDQNRVMSGFELNAIGVGNPEPFLRHPGGLLAVLELVFIIDTRCPSPRGREHQSSSRSNGREEGVIRAFLTVATVSPSRSHRVADPEISLLEVPSPASAHRQPRRLAGLPQMMSTRPT